MLEFLTNLNSWIASHKELVTVIGAPLLTLAVTHILSRSAERRAQNEKRIERQLAREIKISEYRQLWINGLRSELARMCSSLSQIDGKTENLHQITHGASLLQMYMNPNDADYDEFVDTQVELLTEALEGKAPEVFKLTQIGQRILKREWDRLKKDLAASEEIMR